MDSGDIYSTLCHHIACNGAVDTARKQQHSSARGAYGDSSRSGAVACVDICVGVSYLNVYGNIGVLYINIKLGELFKDTSAQLSADLGRLHRETLVGALCLNLECACAGKLLAAVFQSVTADSLKILFGYHRTAYGSSAENSRCPENSLVHVDSVLQRLAVDHGLGTGVVKLAQRLQAVSQVLDE